MQQKINTRVSWLKKASNIPLVAEWKSTFSYTITTGLFGIRVSQGIWASALSFAKWLLLSKEPVKINFEKIGLFLIKSNFSWSIGTTFNTPLGSLKDEICYKQQIEKFRQRKSISAFYLKISCKIKFILYKNLSIKPSPFPPTYPFRTMKCYTWHEIWFPSLTF